MTPDWILAGCAIASSLGSAIFVSFRVGTLVERLNYIERDVEEVKMDLKSYITPLWAGEERRR
jgi:hypothetical protein